VQQAHQAQPAAAQAQVQPQPALTCGHDLCLYLCLCHDLCPCQTASCHFPRYEPVARQLQAQQDDLAGNSADSQEAPQVELAVALLAEHLAEEQHTAPARVDIPAAVRHMEAA